MMMSFLSISQRCTARSIGHKFHAARSCAAPLIHCLSEDNALWLTPQKRALHTLQCHPVFVHPPPNTLTRRNKSIFVSKHNQSLQIAARDILEAFQSHGISAKDAQITTTHVILKECPFCSKPTKNSRDNLFKCYVQIGGGAYFCHRCGASGSWFDLRSRLRGSNQQNLDDLQGHTGTYMSSSSSPRGRESASKSTVDPLPMPPKRLNAVYMDNLTEKVDSKENVVLDYLRSTRGLTVRTLKKYCVGRANYSFLNDEHKWEAAECVTFPWIMSAADITYQEDLRGAKWELEQENIKTDVKAGKKKNKEKDEKKEETDQSTFLTRRIKVRAVENKSWQRLDPPGGGWGLFGYHTVPHDAKEIVVTEGEYDAMAVWQSTGLAAISLPNGCRSLPIQVLPLLERFEKIYLWMDNDAPGHEGAQVFAKKLGLQRCYMVQPTKEHVGSDDIPKDANEALLRGLDLKRIIADAKLIPHERILTFTDLRDDILHEILHPEKYEGTPMTSLPGLTKLMKGFRKGEMTVLTGPTGSGKTTFLGQLSLDLAEQDVNVLWGSFEIKNTRLGHKLLQQYAREPIPTGDPSLATKISSLYDRMNSLPIYLLKFHGGSDIEEVLEAMDYACYVNDVQHVILDNMQFMISRQSLNGSTFDKFDVQDIAIEKFRKFATDRNVHVTLVVHPRKEQENAPLGINSIYGSAKATQEADTVLILQNTGNRKFIEVKKNRFNGDLGMVPLFFDPKSGRYNQAPTLNSEKKQTVTKPSIQGVNASDSSHSKYSWAAQFQ